MVEPDRRLAYHEELFYTHVPLPEDGEKDPNPTSSRVGQIRQFLRRLITASVLGQPQPLLQAALGRLLSTSRTLRQRAFFGISHFELIPTSENPGRALEVGCGSGELLRALMQMGWETEGLEWDPLAAENARRNTGLPVMVGDLRELKISSESFQLVVLHHVIEHIDDPVATLGRIAELLAPGGRVVLVYPNPDAFGASLFRVHWAHWDPPRHLVFPARSALNGVAQLVNLTLTTVRTSDNRNTAWMNAVSRHIREGGSTMDAVMITLRDRLPAVLSRMLIGLGFPWGDELIVVLEKPGLVRARDRSGRSALQTPTPESLAGTSGAQPSM